MEGARSSLLKLEFDRGARRSVSGRGESSTIGCALGSRESREGWDASWRQGTSIMLSAPRPAERPACVGVCRPCRSCCEFLVLRRKRKSNAKFRGWKRLAPELTFAG